MLPGLQMCLLTVSSFAEGWGVKRVRERVGGEERKEKGREREGERESSLVSPLIRVQITS